MKNLDESLMTDEASTRSHANATTQANSSEGRCWSCGTFNHYACGEVCNSCFKKLHANSFDSRGKWIG